MNKGIKTVIAVAVLAGLSGCTSSAQRMYECEEQGISRDACYQVEQGRKQSINAQAEAQAMRNAQAQYPVKAVDTSEGHHHHKKYYDDDSSNQYGQSVHRQNKYETSCSDLKNFVEKGVELTPPQEQQLGKCHLSATAKPEHVIDKGYHPTGKAHTWKGYGITVKQHADGQVFVDDMAALQTENNEHAKVYQSGLYNVIIHDNGKVDLMNNGQFVGHLK